MVFNLMLLITWRIFSSACLLIEIDPRQFITSVKIRDCQVIMDGKIVLSLNGKKFNKDFFFLLQEEAEKKQNEN